MGRRAFRACAIIVMTAVILFVLVITIVKYTVEGETNMPFNLSKITLISSVEGIDKENTEGNRWAFNINQNNDFYFYIEKNKNFKNQETIKSILIDNLQIEEKKGNGETKFYRPNILEIGNTFYNVGENMVQTIEYVGALQTNLKALEISNQGGVICFRCANNNIATYLSNDEEINHAELLKKIGITEEQLRANLKFDLTIKVESGKEYKTTISQQLPIEGIVENGTSSSEITDLNGVVFKRIRNSG